MRWLLAVPIYLVMAVAYAHAPQGTQLSAREVADKASAESKAQQLIQWQVDGSIRMTAPMQDMQAIISPHGITLHSVDEAGDAAFGWRLTQLGRETGLVPVSERGSVGRRGDVVVLLRQEVIEEYRASAEGIRQDFVLPRKPVGDGALTLELAVQGAELAALDDGGSGDIARHTINDQAIGITMADGRELHYHALHVTDADGRHLPAQMHVADAGRLRITVDDAQARYPLRIDPTFTDADWMAIAEPGFNGPIHAAVVGGGNLYVGGGFTAANGGVLANYIAVWNGSAWSTLGSGMNHLVHALVWDGTAQRLYAGGYFTTAGGTPASRIAVWDGSAWSALGAGVNNEVRALAWDGATQRLYVGGRFTTAGGIPASHFAAWNGSTWLVLGSGINGPVFALLWDGVAQRLYAGGYFTAAGGTSAKNIAVWNGSAWSALGSGLGNLGNYVNALAWDGAAQRLYAGGDFVSWVGDAEVNNIAVWNGSAWSALGSGLNNEVLALVWDGAAQRLYAGGKFSAAGDTGADNIAAWDGSVWSTLGSSMNSEVHALVWDGAAQRLYAGGFFSTAGGTAANRIAVWNGSAWSALGSGVNKVVHALAWDGVAQRLYAGGYFTMAGDKPAAIAYAQFETPQAPLNVIATPASILFGETSTLSTSGGSGSGTVSYAVTAGDTFCEVGGATLTGTGLGTCTVTATKEASANYLQATATVEVTITPKVDLEIAKDANRTTAQIGDTVVYSIVVANIGPNDVAGAGISDNPPATLTDVEWACVPPPVSSVVCPPAPHDAGTGPMNVLIDLAANGYLRYDLSGVVQGVIGAQIDNTASVAVPEGITDPEDGNDSASASVLIVPVGLFADGFESVGKPMAVPAAEKTRIRPRE